MGCTRGSTCYTQLNSWLYVGVYQCIWGTAGGKTHISQLSTCWLLTRIIIIFYHASYICPMSITLLGIIPFLSPSSIYLEVLTIKIIFDIWWFTPQQ